MRCCGGTWRGETWRGRSEWSRAVFGDALQSGCDVGGLKSGRRVRQSGSAIRSEGRPWGSDSLPGSGSRGNRVRVWVRVPGNAQGRQLLPELPSGAPATLKDCSGTSSVLDSPPGSVHCCCTAVAVCILDPTWVSTPERYRLFLTHRCGL